MPEPDSAGSWRSGEDEDSGPGSAADFLITGSGEPVPDDNTAVYPAPPMPEKNAGYQQPAYTGAGYQGEAGYSDPAGYQEQGGYQEEGGYQEQGEGEYQGQAGYHAPGARPAAQRYVMGRRLPGRRPPARQAHLTVTRFEPWSVMKFSFAMSLVAFVVLMVAVTLLYGLLSALGVFDSLQHLVSSLTSSQGQGGVNTQSWFTASRVLTYTALLGAVNVVLFTALATIAAAIYNLAARLSGGVEVTLREPE